MVVGHESNTSKPVPSETSEVKKQVRHDGRNFVSKSKENIEIPEKKIIDKKELEALIVKLYHEGQTQSKIGAYLKDSYNIKSVKKILGKTVLEILKDNKEAPELPEDLVFLLRRAVSLLRHQNQNKGDMTAKRGYILTVSKIRALARYYKSKGILPKDWSYDENKAALLVK